MSKVSIDNLALAITKELNQYNQEVTDELKKEVKAVAKECKDEIKEKSPKKTGDYKKGWTVKTAYESNQDIRCLVTNTKKPQITHLLENGHAKVNGGRVDGIPHIAPAEENAAKKLEERVKVKLR